MPHSYSRYKQMIIQYLRGGSKHQADIHRYLKSKLSTCSINTLRKHLKTLEENDIIKTSVQGKKHYFSLNFIHTFSNLDNTDELDLQNFFLLNDFLQNYRFQDIRTYLKKGFQVNFIKKSLLNHIFLLNNTEFTPIDKFVEFLLYIIFIHEFDKEDLKESFNIDLDSSTIRKFEENLLNINVIRKFEPSNKNYVKPIPFYLLTNSINQKQLVDFIDQSVNSVIHSFSLIEEPISLQIFDKINHNIFIEIYNDNLNKFSHQMQNISKKCSFSYYAYLKRHVYARSMTLIKSSTDSCFQILFGDANDFESQILSIFSNELHPHLYITIIKKKIDLFKKNKSTAHHILDILKIITRKIEKMLFPDIFRQSKTKSKTKSKIKSNTEPKGELKTEFRIRNIFKEDLKRFLQGRLKDLFSYSKKILFYLFLRTQSIMLEDQISHNCATFDQTSRKSKFTALKSLWDYFFMKISRKMVPKQNKIIVTQDQLNLQAGTAFRYLIMLSSRLFEEFWEYFNQDHRFPYSDIKQVMDYKQFLLSCYRFQYAPMGKDDTYLIKLLLLFQESELKLTEFKDELIKSRNSVMKLLFFEFLFLSNDKFNQELLHQEMQSFFQASNDVIEISKKLALLTGFLHFIINEEENEIIDERKSIFLDGFSYFLTYLATDVALKDEKFILDLKWFLNLAGIYFYLLDDKKLALICDLSSLFFSFETRSIFPDCLLFQLNPQIHRISIQGKPWVIHPYFMIPHSSMAKALQLITLEKVQLTEAEINPLYDNSRFRPIFNVIKNYSSRTELGNEEIHISNIFTLKKLYLDLILYFKDSITVLNKVLKDVPFNDIFMFNKNLTPDLSSDVTNLIEQSTQFRHFFPVLNLNYFGWILAIINLIKKNGVSFLKHITPLQQQYNYCLPIYAIQLQYATRFNHMDRFEEIIHLLWCELMNDIDIYPNYNVGKFKNRWKLYQFPWILDLLLKYEPEHNLDEYLLLFEYFQVNININSSQNEKILEKFSSYHKSFSDMIHNMKIEIGTFYRKYNITSYYKISSNSEESGYSTELGYYIPEPRPSRIDIYKYINLPEKIAL